MPPVSTSVKGRPRHSNSAVMRSRVAIVHDQPGVTRDRGQRRSRVARRPFTLVDTGGIGLLRREKADDVIVRRRWNRSNWPSRRPTSSFSW